MSHRAFWVTFHELVTVIANMTTTTMTTTSQIMQAALGAACYLQRGMSTSLGQGG